jgi:CSLREA domain-containing protein
MGTQTKIANIKPLLRAFLLFTLLIIFVSPATAATFTVTKTADTNDGTCDADCSLREAINAANVNTGTDTIAFNIPGAGPHTIQPTSPLPEITDPVIIDGYTQPGASPNTNGPGLGSNAVLQIELDGSITAGPENGLHITAGNSVVRGLVVNRCGGSTGTAGIMLETNGGNVIEGNFIGTDITGTTALGNSAAGVWIKDVPNNTIGGTSPAARNIISGNGEYGGIFINLEGATGNLVQGNFIGTDINGTVALGNQCSGVLVNAPNNTIGGLTSGARNIISGNGAIKQCSGVVISGLSGNLVQGNFIGTDVAGSVALGNYREGVSIKWSSKNLIGGTTAGARNVISGNGGGVGIANEGSTENQVQGNFIGTDITGTVPIPNGVGVGIGAEAYDNLIGGTTAGAGNVISGNLGVGVGIQGIPIVPTGNLVQGNFIGTDTTGSINLGNGSYGVKLGRIPSDNTVGGTSPGAGNTIAFNGDAGVVVFGTGDAIQSNSIYANDGLGIDLIPKPNVSPHEFGVTPNDPMDPDTGANNLQNFPVLISATRNVTNTIVDGNLNSLPNTSFRLEFFANSDCDPSDHGEGERFLGSTDVTTNGSGDTNFSVNFLDTGPIDRFITATATDPDNNTSEFSRCALNATDHVYCPMVLKNYCPPLFADNFDDPASGWPVGDDGNVRYEYIAGEYRVLVRPSQWWAGARPGIKASNYVVRADVRNDSGAYGSYGLIFGLSNDWSQFYTFEIDRDGLYGVMKYGNGKWTALATDTSAHINTGTATNSLKILRDGSLIKAYVNGHHLATVSDSSFTGSRYLGLIVTTYDESNVDVYFDDFSVYPPSCNPIVTGLEMAIDQSSRAIDQSSRVLREEALFVHEHDARHWRKR